MTATKLDWSWYAHLARPLGKGFAPSGQRCNVVNIYRHLIEGYGEFSLLYLPEYSRIGLKVTDTDVLDPGGTRKLIPFKLISNQQRFNFTLRCLKEVDVVPTDQPFVTCHARKYIFRHYTFIKDGELHIPEPFVYVSEKVHADFSRAGAFAEQVSYKTNRVNQFRLLDIPLVPQCWANPHLMRLSDMLRAVRDLKIVRTRLNEYIARFPKKHFCRPSQNLWGLPYAVHREEKRVVSDEDLDFYKSSCCEIRIMKYKPVDFIAANMTYKEAVVLLRQVKHCLDAIRFKLRLVVFAMEYYRTSYINWGDAKETFRGDYPKEERLAYCDNALLKKVTWRQLEAVS